MSITSRLAKAEDGLLDALFWQEAQTTARKTGEDPMKLYEELRQIDRTYGHYLVRLPNGKVDAEPMLRAIAAGEGFDYDELKDDFTRLLRRWRR